jgi:hypothetical protein
MGFLRLFTVDLLWDGLVLVVAASIMWGLWRASQPRCAFVVQVRDGEPRVITGTATAAFLQRIREVVASYGVAKATVSGMARGSRIALQFSRDIPPPACQQLRNWWAISGWSLGKNRAANHC